jgi:hypothetical protein
MSKQYSKGFGAVEVLIVLAVVTLLGAGGWYAYHHAHNKAPVPAAHTDTPKKSTSTKPASTDPTADWRTFTSAKGKYSFKYPATWSLAEHLDQCADGLTLIGPSEQSVGACASENSGEVSLYGSPGDNRGSYKLGLDYKDVAITDITVNGVAGTRSTGTVSNSGPEEGVGILPDNTKTVRYVFYTNGWTYYINYSQTPVYPDALNQFVQIVQTFTFTP